MTWQIQLWGKSILHGLQYLLISFWAVSDVHDSIAVLAIRKHTIGNFEGPVQYKARVPLSGSFDRIHSKQPSTGEWFIGGSSPEAPPHHCHQVHIEQDANGKYVGGLWKKATCKP